MFNFILVEQFGLEAAITVREVGGNIERLTYGLGVATGARPVNKRWPITIY